MYLKDISKSRYFIQGNLKTKFGHKNMTNSQTKIICLLREERETSRNVLFSIPQPCRQWSKFDSDWISYFQSSNVGKLKLMQPFYLGSHMNDYNIWKEQMVNDIIQFLNRWSNHIVPLVLDRKTAIFVSFLCILLYKDTLNISSR